MGVFFDGDANINPLPTPSNVTRKLCIILKVHYH